MRSVLCTCTLLILVTGCHRSPERIYTDLFDSVPDGVHILHTQDQAFLDCCIWMHFTINRPDLLKMVESYEVKSVYEHTVSFIHPPEWWKIKSLGNMDTYYEKRLNEGQRTIRIFVNATMTEVYYVDQAGH